MDRSKFQIAYYAHTEAQARDIKAILGLENDEWVEDFAVGMVSVRGEEPEESVARLQFCYGFLPGESPVEIEILTYVSGPNWHQDKLEYRRGLPFLSHIGFHLGPNEIPPYEDVVPAQRMRTTKHTNPYLIEKGYRYEYLIFDRYVPATRKKALSGGGVVKGFPLPFAMACGTDMKYIWRLDESYGGQFHDLQQGGAL